VVLSTGIEPAFNYLRRLELESIFSGIGTSGRNRTFSSTFVASSPYPSTEAKSVIIWQ